MSANVINKISDGFKLFESTLNTGIATLAQEYRVAVERLHTLDGYVLKHPRGILGLLYSGSNYSNTDNKSSVVVMKRDILISVVPIIRFFENPKESSDKYLMSPADYVDFVIDTMSGIEIFNKRPQVEQRIRSYKDNLVDEEAGVWRYLVTFTVPVDFIEITYRNSL